MNIEKKSKLENLLEKVANEQDLEICGLTVQTNLNPIVIDRDSANWQNLYKERTWFICNGWYHHSPYGVDEEFGFPDNIIPIFVSFHMNKSNQIRPDLINYLKKSLLAIFAALQPT